MKKIISSLKKNPDANLIVLSFVLFFANEILSRHSLLHSVVFVLKNPFISIYNTMIIMLTLSLSLLSNRRKPTVMIISAVWLGLGITNCILMGLRGTPLSAVDFTIIKSAYKLITLYVSVPVLILLAALLCGVIAGVIVLFKKSGKLKPHYIRALAMIAFSGVFVFYISKTLITSDYVNNGDNNLKNIYDSYGFECCFSYSLFANGINEPKIYSEEAMNEIFEKLTSDNVIQKSSYPNVIVLQLESFFDPSYLDYKDLKFSKEPVPNFKKLKDTCIHGFLEVPSFGGGTANTEFEVLSQLNINDFGLGEYPYTTVLKKGVCESVAYDLKRNGYYTHALHNNTATFYDRNKVYANLGFDTFTPVECMQNIKRNSIGWAKDSILEDEIFDLLNASKSKDFVFAVSVQGHGQYPSESSQKMPISVSGTDDEKIKTNLEFYLSQINEMDAFLGNMVKRLESFPEKTVLVVYGDHLPCLALGEQNTEQIGFYNLKCDRFNTEYCIWSNYPLDDKNEDIPAYKLSSKILKSIGIRTGMVTKLNLAELPEKEYHNDLKMFAYDMLYGEGYTIKKERIKPVTMTFGVNRPVITGINGNKISGKNFNEFSIVYINGNRTDTEFVDGNTLIIRKAKPGDSVTVSQCSDFTVLSTSNEYIVK